MPQVRDILHVDVDAFFASVEQVLEPRYRGKPLIVGGNPNDRSVVASASYEARAFGVRSAMPLAKARRLCPDAIFVSGNFKAYSDFSHRIRAILQHFSPVVEVASLDDFYLDYTGCRRLHGPPLQAAERMKGRILAETGLNVTVAIAGNKMVAKVASDLAKPNGIIEVRRGSEEAFLRALPVGKLPGVGPAAEETLRKFNLRAIGDLAKIPREMLQRMFGEWGLSLWESAHGRDDSPVSSEPGLPKSISRESTFSQDTTDRAEIRDLLYSLAERASRQLREEGLLARRVTVKVRYADFETVSACQTLRTVTDQDKLFYEAALEKLDQLLRKRRLGIRLIGVALSGFVNLQEHQGDLFSEGDSVRGRRFYRGLDRLRERFGFGIAAVGPSLRLKEKEDTADKE